MTEELKEKLWWKIFVVAEACQDIANDESVGPIIDKYTDEIILLVENEERSS